MTYMRRNTSLSGATFAYQWSATLQDGDWTTFTPVDVTTNSGSPVEEVTITLDAALLNNPALFVRIVATTP